MKGNVNFTAVNNNFIGIKASFYDIQINHNSPAIRKISFYFWFI
jgi:hypothetical protein